MRVAAAGRRVLARELRSDRHGPKPLADFIVVLNWFDQLREQERRVAP